MTKQWSNLALVVYKRTYARKDTGRTENWIDSVERALLGNVRGHNVSEKEVAKLRRFMTERKGGPAGRGWWYSGSPGHGRLGGVALNNCLAEETEIITANGIKRIGDLSGTIQTLLTDNGKWVDAPIRSFGVQSLLKVTLRRGHAEKIVYATPGHIWKVVRDDRTESCVTASLKTGDRCASNFGQGVQSVRPSPFGIAQGFVFGDGTETRSISPRASGKVVMCDTKDAALLRYFAGCARRQTELGLEISDLPNTWKELPNIRDSKSFLYGWLAGYFAADGSVKEDGLVRLASVDRGALEFVRSVCAVLGIRCLPITKQERVSNLTEGPSTLFSLTLDRAFLTDEFFIIASHRRRIRETEPEREIARKAWKVVNVEDSGRKEEVYCAQVCKTHTFTLADNILTGNCWGIVADDWTNFVVAQDLLMLGGGVGMSVEHQYVSKLPRIRKDVKIVHKPTKDADFIIPDSREGWNELTRRVLESYFVTGKSFSYSTVCVRGAGEPIVGFGGTASGPGPLVAFVTKLCALLETRAGKAVRPIDAADILCSIAEMVVAGNVRRSALIIIGDPWDKVFLRAKRWDLVTVPSQRSNANFSVVCEDVEDLHPLFWETYHQGEPFGLVNRTNMRKFGRMGELKKDSAVTVNPCAEATLEANEPCNLQEIPLPNLSGPEEFEEVGRLMHRWGKRVTCENYHHAAVQEVVTRNRRVGTGVTGCLQAPKLFNPTVLDRVYAAIQDENVSYSKELGIAPSIRTTVVKPSGTLSKMFDVQGEGIHCGFARYMIQRVRFSASDPLIPRLREAGHHMEPEFKLDGTLDHGTQVVDFYIKCPDDLPTADEGFDTWQQLDTLLMAQKHWADQAVSVTVYYRKHEIPQLKAWLSLNLKRLKTISFLCWNDHGFKQAPKEAITAEQYERFVEKVTPVDVDDDIGGQELGSDGLECQGGACPVK